VRRAPLIAAVACLALALGGCEADPSSPGVQRNALLAPDFIASTAAEASNDPQAKWLLKQPKSVRESYVHEVLDKKGDKDLLSQRWLLTQSDDVRESYVSAVVDPKLGGP